MELELDTLLHSKFVRVKIEGNVKGYKVVVEKHISATPFLLSKRFLRLPQLPVYI
jgi:hypothetical protein